VDYVGPGRFSTIGIPHQTGSVENALLSPANRQTYYW
jgi:hypothetical protein